MSERQRLVILGGGFAGVNVAKQVLKMGRGNEEVMLISANEYHTFTPWLYEIAAESADEHERGEKRMMAKSADIPLKIIDERIKVRLGVVTGLEIDHKQVVLADGHTVHYDVLVIALGSETAYFGIPGLRENSLALKSTYEAVAIRQKLAVLVERVKRGDAATINIVLGGAGPSGVELAAELATMAQGLVRRGVIGRNSLKITLVDGAERVLNMMAPKVSRKAEHRLRVLGIEVVLGARINEVRSGEVLVKDGAGMKALPSDCTIWMGGVQPTSTLKSFGLPKDQRGRLLVDDKFEVQGSDSIFALGDAAVYVDEVTKQSLPQTAQAAENAAPFVARNVLLALRRRQLKPYKFVKKWPYSIAIGGSFGILGYGNLTLGGWVGYVIRRLADLRYFFRLLPFAVAVKFWWRGVLEYRKND